MALVSSLFFGCNKGEDVSTSEIKEAYSEYLSAADVQYAYDIAQELSTNTEFFNNSFWGGRNSGSDAEHRVADFLVSEMEKIGLKEVSKDAFTVDKWQFNSSELTILSPEGEETVIQPYSYASGSTSLEGINAELVYVGDGTMYDYEDIDVKDKIVLIDLNQRENWWVTYPSLEASYQGAAAIINNNVGGFSEISEEANNSQDFCGPVTIPSLNISVKEANYLKELLEQGPVTVNLKVDNVVEENGTSYNIVGKIPGKNPEEMIIVGDHYDVHFTGFQDNNCAVGLTLAIAKGIIDSGYQPERTLVFVLHGSEEYGAIDSIYDWAIGAWNQVNTVHPDWVGKALAYINFELPAFEFADSTHVATTPELYSFIKDYVENGAPVPEGCYPEGVITEGYPQFTYSDDFPYTAAGIPSMVNGFLITPDGEDVYDFYYQIYHSQFDTSDTYNEAVLDFNLKFYGSLAIALDQRPGLELDFTNQYERISESLDEEICASAEVDLTEYQGVLEEFNAVALEKYNQILQLNTIYAQKAAEGASEEELSEIMQVASDANKINLKVYKMIQDEFLKISAESPIVAHEKFQENIALLTESIEKLEESDVNYVVDELLWQVDGVLEWYNYYFSKPVIDHMTAQLFAPEYQDNLFWGTGKILPNTDLYDVSQSLMGKYDMPEEDFTQEISVMEAEIEKQKTYLAEWIQKETQALKEITSELQKIDLSSIVE